MGSFGTLEKGVEACRGREIALVKKQHADALLGLEGPSYCQGFKLHAVDGNGMTLGMVC